MAEEVAAEGTTEVGSDEGLGQGPEGLTTDGVGEQAASGSVEEPKFTVRVDGRELEVTLDELTAGYSRQQDYTKKTQALAAEKQRVAQLDEMFAALERNPQATLMALASALGVSFGPAAAASTADEELDPIERIERKFEQFMSTQEQSRQQEQQSKAEAQRAEMVEAKVRQELADLHDTFGEFDDSQLMQYAVGHGIVDLGVAMRAFQFDQDQDRRIRERNSITASKRNAQVVEGGTSVAPGSTVKGGSQKMTLRESLLAAIADA